MSFKGFLALILLFFISATGVLFVKITDENSARIASLESRIKALEATVASRS